MITRKTDELNDSLGALFEGDTGPVRTAPIRENDVEFRGAVERFEEKCTKCRGTGKFISYSGRQLGPCFACKGAGKFTFKTSPESRANASDQRHARKDRQEQGALDAFKAAQPAVAAWIEAEHLKFAFAADMRASILRFGGLTANQLAACQRLADKAAAKTAERIERLQTAPQVDTAGVDRLKEAFDKAKAYAAAKGPRVTIRNPKITIGGMTISPAKASSANAGALYVKQGEEYLGKIMNGQFLAVRACTDAQRDHVLAFVADPAKAAKAYGQETGVCCVCNATLKSKWRLRGIGPVCAEKMGWAGLAEDFGVDL
jgi:uncharacterized protein DUF6011